MTTEIASPEQFERYISEQSGVLAYFAAPNCAVCVGLEPRVEAMARELFPRLARVRVDCEQARELAAQLGVFTIPTVIVYFEGQETVRKSRSFSLGELREAIERPYHLFF